MPLIIFVTVQSCGIGQKLANGNKMQIKERFDSGNLCVCISENFFETKDLGDLMVRKSHECSAVKLVKAVYKSFHIQYQHVLSFLSFSLLFLNFPLKLFYVFTN